MKKFTHLILLLSFLFSFSQKNHLGVIAFNEKSKSLKIEAKEIGIIPSLASVNFDRNYSNKNFSEIQLDKKLDSLIDKCLLNNLKVSFVNYTNISEDIPTKLGFLAGSLEHGKFEAKKGFPENVININNHTFQIGVCIRSFPVYSNNRTFYYLFIYDKLKKKVIGYEQIVVDYSDISDLSVPEYYISILIANLNNQFF